MLWLLLNCCIIENFVKHLMKNYDFRKTKWKRLNMWNNWRIPFHFYSAWKDMFKTSLNVFWFIVFPTERACKFLFLFHPLIALTLITSHPYLFFIIFHCRNSEVGELRNAIKKTVFFLFNNRSIHNGGIKDDIILQWFSFERSDCALFIFPFSICMRMSLSIYFGCFDASLCFLSESIHILFFV